MSTEDYITELFCRVDDAMQAVEQPRQSKLTPAELVVIGLLFVLKGRGQRAFYRWLKRDWLACFPQLTERTRLFRNLAAHQDWVNMFLADPSLLGIIDSYGIELIHPYREGRSEQQMGRKGQSNHRWIVGIKLCLVINHLGAIVAWDFDTANVYDGTAFQQVVDQYADKMVIFSDVHFIKDDWQPTHLRPCPRGVWNDRMLIETVFSMMTTVFALKRMRHRVPDTLRMHLAYAVALFNLLLNWSGLRPDDNGFVPLSIAQFSL